MRKSYKKLVVDLKERIEDEKDPKEVMKEVLKNCKKVEDDCEIYF